MAYNNLTPLDDGDEFLDLDKRFRGLRVVRVVSNPKRFPLPGDKVLIKTVAAPPENPKAVGRHSMISAGRLQDDKKFRRVSR